MAVSLFPIKGNYKIYVVRSGSMEPKIRVGSIVVSQPVGNYKVGDVISFNSGATKKENTTHRITEIKDSGGTTSYITKGDANENNDTKEVPADKVLGKEIFTIPLLGYLLVYVKTLPGLVLLIIIPATIISYDEFNKIKSEALVMAKKRKERKNAKKA